MTPAPPDLFFRRVGNRSNAVPILPGYMVASHGHRVSQRDVDDVSLWQGRETEILVTERLVVAVAGTPRRAIPDASVDAGSVPIDAAEIHTLWLRDGANALAMLASCFAIVIFDRHERKTHLAVDSFGLASLFWQIVDDDLWVCTEQAPLVGRQAAPELDRLALTDVFNLRFLSGSRTLWEGLHQVRPGTLVTVEDDRVRTSETRRVRFEPGDYATTVQGFAAETLTRLERCFGQRHDEGVREASVLLSGGVDSTIMAAIAARTFPRCIAYTARIEGFPNPELPRAAEVASRLSIEHRIVDVTQDDLTRLFPFVMDRVQEPPRHFNNLVLARLFEELSDQARFVVAGDAADTLFGADSLRTIRRLAGKRRRIRILPRSAQLAFGKLMSRSSNRRLRSLGKTFVLELDQLIQRFDVIPRSSRSDILLRPLVCDHAPSEELVSEHFRPGRGDFETFQQWHLATFSASIFRRNHRLSTPFGLQLWYPLLDPAIVELARRMPRGLKVHPDTGESKPVLREICATIAGRDVADWSKMGFPSPERELITGPLRAEWAACNGPDALVAQLFNRALLSRLDPSLDYQTAWTLLTLEHLWRRQRSDA